MWEIEFRLHLAPVDISQDLVLPDTDAPLLGVNHLVTKEKSIRNLYKSTKKQKC